MPRQNSIRPPPSLSLEVVEVEVLVVVAEEEEGRREGHAPNYGERVLQEQRGGLRGGERRGEIVAQWPYLRGGGTICQTRPSSSQELLRARFM